MNSILVTKTFTNDAFHLECLSCVHESERGFYKVFVYVKIEKTPGIWASAPNLYVGNERIGHFFGFDEGVYFYIYSLRTLKEHSDQKVYFFPIHCEYEKPRKIKGDDSLYVVAKFPIYE